MKSFSCLPWESRDAIPHITRANQSFLSLFSNKNGKTAQSNHTNRNIPQEMCSLNVSTWCPTSMQKYERRWMHPLTVMMHSQVRRHQIIWPTRASCLTCKLLNAKMDCPVDSRKQPTELMCVFKRQAPTSLTSKCFHWIKMTPCLHLCGDSTYRFLGFACVRHSSKPSGAERREGLAEGGSHWHSWWRGSLCCQVPPPPPPPHQLHEKRQPRSFQPVSKGDSSVESINDSPSKKKQG